MSIDRETSGDSLVELTAGAVYPKSSLADSHIALELAILDEKIDQARSLLAFDSNGEHQELTGDPEHKRRFSPSLYHKNKSVIKEDERVLVKLPSTGSKLVELKKDKIVSLGKFGMFKVNDILGHKFGQTFEVLDDNNIKPVDGKEVLDDITAVDDADVEDETAPEDTETEGQVNAEKVQKDKNEIINKLLKYSEDNSNLFDLGDKVQKLSAADIETMKKQSYSSETGRQIIESIINQHGNFDKKTKYSQAKYLKRKREKYARYFVIEYLSAHELLKYYIENKDLRKSLDLSEESMAYMLNLANIRPGGRYLIIDESMGLLTYCMLERMAGEGEIIIVSENEHVNLSALEKYSNFPQIYIQKMVKCINWLQLLNPVQDTIANDEAFVYFEPILDQQVIEGMVKHKKSQYYRKLTNYAALLDVLRSLKQANFDALVLVTTLYIPNVLDCLVSKIGGSRPIVVFSQFKELLVETYHHINNPNAPLPILAPSVLETKARNYQAVPGKIHPVMTMRGGGGFILSGTRIFPLEKVQAVGKGGNKKKKQRMEKVEKEEENKAEKKQ